MVAQSKSSERSWRSNRHYGRVDVMEILRKLSRIEVHVRR
jgi:hypothetical protein